jgi:hypothetical protein
MVAQPWKVFVHLFAAIRDAIQQPYFEEFHNQERAGRRHARGLRDAALWRSRHRPTYRQSNAEER